MVSTRTRQAAAFGAFRREGVESCRWGAFGAFFGAFFAGWGESCRWGRGAQLDRPRGVLAPYPSSERLRRVWPRSLDAAIGRRMGVTRVLEVLLPLSSTRRPSVEACTTKNAIIVRSARDEARQGTGSGRRMGGSLGSAPERLGSGGCDAHACRDCSGGWELAGGHGGGRARARACMWAAMRASHLAAGADIGDLDDHGWIARWANNLGHVLA